ncbi:zinc finger protein 14-like [Topomyia yanbarensis]|uniref:zinc finger protein 14-like n=1 Tax=Topomyia yanbarensis TaxID=2498891 RepID=UPI00273CEB02|nr:zinc finger protein 14-like [Topomyia yanbarensis]
MSICRACGQNLLDFDQRECLEEYAEIYFHLTSIRLHEHEDPSQSVLCSLCIKKLEDFDKFRKTCIQVHWSLQNVKAENSEEVCQETIAVEIELKSEYGEEENRLLFLTDNSSNEQSNNNVNDDGSEPKRARKYKTWATRSKKGKYEDDPKKPKKKNARKDNQVQRDPKEQRQIYSCEQCPKRFHMQSKFEAHKRTHDGLKPYECEICHHSFTGWHYLRFHRIQKHSGNKVLLPCDHPGCEQQFSTRYALKRHKTRTHDPNFVPEATVFVCDTCGKTFNSNGNLKKHKYTHTPAEMPFVCGVCSKQFPTSNKLKEHNLRHEGVKNHTCPQCGLRKTTMHELRQHIKHMHAAPRSVACEICPRRFNNVGSLNVHVRIVHLGEKRYKCTVCEWAFGRSDHLKRHMKSHMG